MKKLLIIAIVLIMVCPISAIAANDLSAYTTEQLEAMRTQIDNELARRSSTQINAGSSEGTLGDYYVKIKGFSLSKDYEGNPCLVVDYVWTNKSDETASFMWSLTTKAFQNGIELESGFAVDNCDSSNSMLEIRPGATLEVQDSFELRDTKNPVEIEVSESFSWDSNPPIVSSVIKLN